MYRYEKIVKLKVLCGPEWQAGCHYDGEVLKFAIEKFTSEFGESAGTLFGRFVEPIELLVKVNHIASPIHVGNQIIRGVVMNDPGYGKLRSDSRYDTNLTYLRQSDEVRVVYNTSCRTGYVIFEGEWLRMRAQGEALNFLTTDENIAWYGRMIEMVQYAKLREQVTDVGKIQFVRDITRFADINEPSPEVYQIENHYDPVKDSLLMVPEQPITIC